MTMKEGAHMTRVVRSLRNGQMTIPAEFRKQLGIGDDSLLQVTLAKGELHIKPLRAAERPIGSAWLISINCVAGSDALSTRLTHICCCHAK